MMKRKAKSYGKNRKNSGSSWMRMRKSFGVKMFSSPLEKGGIQGGFEEIKTLTNL